MVNLDESIEKEIESIYANIKREVKHLQNYNKSPQKNKNNRITYKSCDTYNSTQRPKFFF
jgi:hypothetical protein